MLEHLIALNPPLIFAAVAVLMFIAAWFATKALRTPAPAAGKRTSNAAKYRRALDLFRLGTELMGKIPHRGDSKLDVLVKLLAMFDAAEKVYGGRSKVYSDIFSRYDLRERTSEPFVRLFFGTKMVAGFTLHRHVVNEHCELIEAVAPDGERLFFQEHRYGRPEISSEFFYTPSFNFTAALSALWESYPHGLYLAVKPAKGWGPDVTFNPMAPPSSALVSRKAAVRIAEGADEWRSRAGAPWCFLAYGPPGTGKTSYVRGLAAEIGARLLVLDATSLPHLGVQEVAFLLAALTPGVVLIDDFCEAPVDEARARLRYLFENLHAPGLTIAITVNDPSKLDGALLRSERIDDAKLFPLPDEMERAEMLERLVAHHVPGKLTAVEIAALARDTDGYNHADLAGLVKRFRTKIVPAAFADMQRLRDLAAASAKKEETPAALAPKSPEA